MKVYNIMSTEHYSSYISILWWARVILVQDLESLIHLSF